MNNAEEAPQHERPLTPPPKREGAVARAIIATTIVLGIGALLALAVMEGQQSGGSLGEGAQAPPFTMEKYGGGEVSLESLRGKVVMLDFWATWCPPCIEEMPHLIELAKTYEDQGLVFLAANRDDPPNHKATVGVFMARRAPELPPYVAFASDQMARDYAVMALPTIYFIDGEGRIIDSARGALSERQLRKRIEKALGRE